MSNNVDVRLIGAAGLAHIRNLATVSTTYASATNKADFSANPVRQVTIRPVVNLSDHFTPTNISTNATTTVFTGAGVLHTFLTNTSGTGSTATLYDSTGGLTGKFATVNTAVNNDHMYDAKVVNGLTIVTAGTTPADITVTWDLLASQPVALAVMDAPNDAVASSWLTDAGSASTDVQYYFVFADPAETENVFRFTDTNGNDVKISRVDILPLIDGMRIRVEGIE